MRLSRLSNSQLRRLLRRGEVRFGFEENVRKSVNKNKQNISECEKAARIIQQAINKLRNGNYSDIDDLVDWKEISRLTRWYEDDPAVSFTNTSRQWNPWYVHKRTRIDEMINDLKLVKKKILDIIKWRKIGTTFSYNDILSYFEKMRQY